MPNKWTVKLVTALNSEATQEVWSYHPVDGSNRGKGEYWTHLAENADTYDSHAAAQARADWLANLPDVISTEVVEV